MRKSFVLTLLMMPFLSLISLPGLGQIFSATYPFTNVTTLSGTTDPTPVPTATGATFSSFSAVGQTSTNPNAGSRFSFTAHPLGATNASDIFTGSISTTQYYQVTITPEAGYSLDLNSITFTLQRSGTGIRQYAVRSGLDYTTNLPASISPANANLSVVATDIFQVSDATSVAENGSTITLGSSYDAITSPVTFRFYGWNAEASGGTFSIDNVVFNGSATSVSGNPSVNLSVSDNTGSEAGATVITVTAISSQAVSGDQTIDLGVSGTNITSGDYSLSNLAITILSGQTTGTATFTIADDNDVEVTETATLTISNPSSGITLGSTTTQNISITDNDAAPSVSVVTGIAAAEPATNGTFTINLSSPAPAGGVNVNYTLTGSAALNTDYSDALSGVISIAEGQSSGTVTLNVSDDPDIEGTETITITLNSATNSYDVGVPASANINLLDNDNPPIVINEVYGGGGNAGATYKNDFIELYNPTNASVNLNGWSVQYGSGASGNVAWSGKTNLTGSIPAHGYYLVQQAAGTAVGTFSDLPTPDDIGTINMSATAGKVALVANTNSLPSGCPGGAAIDLVGYGTTTACFEGAGQTPAPSNSTSVQRTPAGFDANANNTDFTVGAPSPKNTVTDVTPPAVSVFSPANNAINIATAFIATITFNEVVTKGTGNITLKKTSDGSIVKLLDLASADVILSGSSVSFLIQSLEFNSSYYFEISNGAFKDLEGLSFAGISGNSTWSFVTTAQSVGVIGNTYTFNTCTSGLTDGFSFYSVAGPQIWGCTTFGRNPADLPLGSLANGVQINGFSGTNIPNIDWLISPSFDLTGTTYPLLSFWSRTAFNGKPLQLKISTDYNGGDPAAATWTDINGKFPGQTSNAWTLSENINLSAFKQSNVHFAYVYTSTDDDGARWTLDDISVTNSPVPPPPSLTVSTEDIQFTYVASGSTADKTFTFIGNDLTDNVSLNATGDFLLSKDGVTFSTSVFYTQAEANDLTKTVTVRFAPTQNNVDFSGSITVTTSTLSETINLKGTSIDPVTTLEVVNWNVEWFGSTSMAPNNDNLQEQNVKTILQNLNADVYALSEVVSEARLANVVNQMPGYSYVISNYGSHTNPNSPTASTLAEAQKLAFVYKTSLFSNITTTAVLSAGINSPADISNPAYGYWASGRFPFMMSADVTLNCVTKNVKFILVHAKANTAPTNISYDRRKKGADSLHFALQQNYANDNIIILGDYNDDLDQSITDGFITTSWNSFTTDAVNFTPVTLPLSLAGKKSTVSYNDVIDHVTVSNDLVPYYLNGSASILTDVTSLVSNYGSTTTDHYPAFSRYRFSNTTAPSVESCTAEVTFCATNAGTYTIPTFIATDDCSDVISYGYEITGATARSGSSNNASGAFSVGVSTIVWTATDNWGNTNTCQTIVTINPKPSVVIPNAFALASGTLANTVYIGYAPASSITLTAQASGGTPGYSYSWTSGSLNSTTTVSPVVNTAYTVTVTDTKGCQAMASKNIAVMDIRGGKKLDKVIVCHTQSGIPNSLIVNNSETAIHLAHGDMLGSCVGSITQKLVYSEGPAGSELSIQVLSNPSSTRFTLLVSGGIETAKINLRITDINGRVIEQKTNLSTTQAISIGDKYRTGIYLAEVMLGNEKKVVKLIKIN